MICDQIASAAGIYVNFYDRYSLQLADEEFAGFIKMLHECAPKSSVAKTAYERILSAAEFKGDWTSESEVIIDSTTPLTMGGFCGRGGVDIFSGTTIDIRDCVRDIGLDVEMTCHLPDYADKEDQENLVKLDRELSQLCRLPNLRQARLTVWIPVYGDAYYRPMIFFERMSSAIKRLRKRVDGNLEVSIHRDFIYGREKFDFIDPYNVSWMWDPPTLMSRADTDVELVAVEQRIRKLFADGVNPNGDLTLLEELHAAVHQLPQNKNDILEMDDWSVGTGITKEKWLKIKKTWKRPS